ncbi:MAG TPA: glycoside hydrolase family 52 protein [Opitutaceae bacterium]
MSTESYHTQHAPFGAFASFTVGLVGGAGGFGQSLRGPARQNVYVGFRRGREAWRLLPFFVPPKSSAAVAYTGEAAQVGAPPPEPLRLHSLSPADYERRLDWASDAWTSGGFGFGLRTPFDRIPEPETLSAEAARFHFAPVVCGYLSYDNTAGAEAVELVFGIGEADAQMRPLDDTRPALAGFAGGNLFGYATAPSPDVSLRQGFSVFEDVPRDVRGLHVLGGETALVFKVPAGARREFPLVLGFYQAGVVTTGLTASYAYTRWFDSLEAVLQHGLEQHARYTELALRRDAELAASRLDADQKYLVAQATHSYLASTQLFQRADGRLLWVVNEGEYRMVNTFDLTVDHVFFELAWHPWAVRNTLDLFVERYAYLDEVRTPEGTRAPGGVSFTHDMGIMNHFTPAGRSSYECDNLSGCFSHMTMEQLLNWVLTAVTYAWRTEDWDWLGRNHPVLLRCVDSLERRDHPDSAKRDGILKCDSSRCGTGSEITTYDSLDVSLGQARNNLYLAVKTLGAWILLGRALRRLDDVAAAKRATLAVSRLCRSLVERFEEDTGFFPAVFEQGNHSRIIPAVEGFAYPLYLGMEDELAPLAPLIERLRKHLRGIFKAGVCLDATSGGWKLSSTSTNTWFSKIALCQHVIRRLFPDTLTPEARAADRVHADWQRRRGCGAFAMCDQILSDSGKVCGSRFYPRGVTTYLWLLE